MFVDTDRYVHRHDVTPDAANVPKDGFGKNLIPNSALSIDDIIMKHQEMMAHENDRFSHEKIDEELWSSRAWDAANGYSNNYLVTSPN